MAGNRKRNSDRQKAHYKNYEVQGKCVINQRKRVARHLKNFPNDTCAKTALERDFVFTRKAPKTSTWSHGEKATAVLFTEFGRSGKEVLDMKKAKAARMRASQEAHE